MMQSWVLLVLALWLPASQAYHMYTEEIPNGDHVPHPCKPNYLWHGVGHQNSKGGGARNPFGEDFAANGHKWTQALCRADSDGDGRTNGQELGDPDCVWSKGQTPPVTQGLSHPGVCDPFNAAECRGKNAWVDCTRDEEFKCDAIHDPEVRNITLRFPRTKVPAKETTYICFNFELPDDREYHLIATKPFIDNHNVMHHIVLSRCDNSVKLKDEPEDCLMGTEGCSQIMALWALGITGSCLIPETGYLIGKGHTRMISMQFHWTNPTEVDTWYDSSGMVLYYTPKLRQYNAGILTIGQTSLTIPPGMGSWVEEGSCTSRCTSEIMEDDIHVFQAINHMHYLGIRQNVTLTRQSGEMQVLTDDNPYNYDSPKVYGYADPITVRPGDDLKTYCTYQSRSRAGTTRYGEGSFDEMCFAFLYYYPEESLLGKDASCTQHGDVDMCILQEVCDEQVYNSSAPSTAAAVTKILKNCDASGVTCWAECERAVQEVLDEHLCWKETWGLFVENVYKYVWDPTMLKFVSAMQSCLSRRGGEGGATMVTPRPHTPTTERPGTSGTVRPTMDPGKPTMPEGPGGWLLNLVKHLDARPLLQNIIMNVNYNYGSGSKKTDDHDDTWH